MAEKEVVFGSSVKYNGVFSFKDLYKFSHDWLVEETNLIVVETKYQEKVVGTNKEIEVVWEPFRKLTDYFKFDSKITFRIIPLSDVEITNEKGEKIKTNKGNLTISAKGTLVRDWQGKFETTGFRKFLRGVYEKYILASRIEQFEDKIVGDLDEFLEQAKAFLALQGRK